MLNISHSGLQITALAQNPEWVLILENSLPELPCIPIFILLSLI